MKDIHYHFEDEAAEAEASLEAAETGVAAPAVAAPVASNGPVAGTADEPLKAIDTLRVNIARKLKNDNKSARFPSQSLSKTLAGASRPSRTIFSAILTLNLTLL